MASKIYGNNVVGDGLRSLRREAGLTQDQIAQKLQRLGVDLDRKAVSKVETGLRGVSDWELYAFSIVLNSPTDAFFPSAPQMRAYLEHSSDV